MYHDVSPPERLAHVADATFTNNIHERLGIESDSSANHRNCALANNSNKRVSSSPHLCHRQRYFPPHAVRDLGSGHLRSGTLPDRLKSVDRHLATSCDPAAAQGNLSRLGNVARYAVLAHVRKTYGYIYIAIRIFLYIIYTCRTSNARGLRFSTEELNTLPSI